MHNAPIKSYRLALYARKSSEDSGRQIQSIESQMQHMTQFAAEQGLNITHIFKDEGSAHKPNNRSAFNEMMESIHEGKIDGILTWAANRLSRNPIEGGQLIYALQSDTLKIIITPHKQFFPQDNMIPLQIEFGMANEYSRNLSRNIKRGNKTKIENGGWCSVAPTGYLNDRVNKTIIKDPDRFHLVKKMFKLYLTGNYSLFQICKLSTKWGFKTPLRKTRGNKPIAVATLYNMLKNPFYYGLVYNGGHKAIGKHPPIISKSDFDKIQSLLRGEKNKKNKHGKNITFPYTGLFTCGECGSAITAETKTRYRCPKCKKRHTARQPKLCSCGHYLSQKIINKGIHYTYLRCTKQKGNIQKTQKCSQCSIRQEAFEKQILDFLTVFSNLGDEFYSWLVNTLKSENATFIEYTSNEKAILQKKIEKIKLEQKSLLHLAISGTFSHDEIIQQKQAFQKEIENYKQEIQHLDNSQQSLNVEKILKQLKELPELFQKLPPASKKRTLRILASNRTFTDQKILLEWAPLIQNLLVIKDLKTDCFEPTLDHSHKGLSWSENNRNSMWYTSLNKLRTLFQDFEGLDFINYKNLE